MNDKTANGIKVYFQYKNAQGQWVSTSARLTVTAKDFAEAQGRVFFGDRPLDNPGYSSLSLKGEVSLAKQTSGTIDRLDVFKVEQRLRYLGFPALGYGYGNGGQVPALTTIPQGSGSYRVMSSGNTVQNFTVDGSWGTQESHAAYLFSRVVTFTPTNGQLATPQGRNPQGKVHNSSTYFAALASGVSNYSLTASSTAFAYLNAYNAPHWMNIGSAMQAPNVAIRGWINRQFGADGTTASNVEKYGTSWMRDLLVAKNYSQALAGSRNAQFNGAVDANHGYTPFGHGTHDLGMALDLGVRDYVERAIQNKTSEVVDPRIAGAQLSQPSGAWSDANAITLLGFIPNTSAPLNRQDWALGDFLALYSVTQSRNGSRDALSITNPTVTRGGASVDVQSEIRAALFGGGTLADGLISQVLVGDPNRNDYPSMHAIFGRLGLAGISGTSGDHHNHFHIYLRPPGAKPIQVASQQHAETVDRAADHHISVLESARILEEQLTEDVTTGEETMLLTLLIPLVMGSQAAPVASAAPVVNKEPTMVLTDCGFFESGAEFGTNGVLNPALAYANYMHKHHGERIPLKGSTVEVTKSPVHGRITSLYFIPNDGQGFKYSTEKAFKGEDKVEFLVSVGGKRIKIVAKIYVNPDEPEICSEFFETKRIGQFGPASLQVHADLNHLIASASSAIAGVHDLPGSAVGETSGVRQGAQITLDTTAAGHGWFIDPTPLNNSEYLPTADPNVWKARAGSAADGKMDMLSVLLHEYGHVLGLEHSANAHDTMAASLAPGVRRLPTADEMALMSRLVAELRERDDSAAAGDIGDIGSGTPGQPLRPDQPEPLLPTGSRTAGNQRAGRRPAAGNDATPNPQFEGAVNSTLSNGDFGADATTGWVAQGAVTTTAADSSATLAESSTGHTHLAQGFVVNPGDRIYASGDGV